ncbi:MAG: hypothetical protein QOE55_611, partial [Acidobacteriaceae bacterium]|nr:hypothetical protein [Acidobacteriaceae bacterium]
RNVATKSPIGSVINIGCSGWPIGKHRNSPPHWRVKDVLTYFESHGLQVSDDWYAPQPERGAGIQPRPISFYFSPVGGTALVGSLRSVRSSFATHSPAHSFVPFMVPTSLHPLAAFGFTCIGGLAHRS